MVCALEYYKIAKPPGGFKSYDEIFRLIQGSIFFLGGLLALSRAGIKLKILNFKKDIKADIKIALKYFSGYILAVALFIGIASSIIILLLKMDLFTIDTFNNYRANLIGDKLTQKSYLSDVIIYFPIRFFLYLFATCVLIPMEEEIFMRRLLYVSLRHKMSFFPSLIISSVIFAITHLGIATIFAFIVGIFLGWIYEKHQSLPVNIMVHGLINFLTVLAMIFIN